MKKSLESLTHAEFERLANEAVAEAVAQAMARGVPVVDGKVMTLQPGDPRLAIYSVRAAEIEAGLGQAPWSDDA